MWGVMVLLLKDYLKLGLTGALIAFFLFRCWKVLFNDRERSVTCQRYYFRPIKLNESGLLHFNNNNNTYIAPISILLFSSALKKYFPTKKYRDCIKYTCINCISLPTKVETIMSTL